EADPATVSRRHERRRVRARPPLCDQLRGLGLYGHSHRRTRGVPRACAGLPQARAGGIRPRGPGLDGRQCRAGRDGKSGARFLSLLRAREGRLAAAKNMIDTFSLEINARAIPAERLKAYQEAFIAGWGGFPLIGTKEQIVDGLQALSRAG